MELQKWECGNLGIRSCGQCTQSVCCAWCVYASVYEHQSGLVNGKSYPDDCGVVPHVDSMMGLAMCCSMALLDWTTPIYGIIIRTGSPHGHSFANAAAAECCGLCTCYGSPCHMNNYRVNHFVRPIKTNTDGCGLL